MKNVNMTKEQETGFGYSLDSSVDEGAGKIAMTPGRKSEKGVVLVVVLVLSAVVLAVMTALVYMILSGTQISGFQKRYKTALEAAKGGSELLYQVVGSRNTSIFTGVSTNFSVASSCTGTDVFSGATYTGLQAKFKTPSSTWSAACSPGSLTINPSDSTTYDMKLVLGTGTQYNYYAKIVGVVEGNSASLNSSSLYTGSVITGGSEGGSGGSIPVVSMPYLYAIEVDTENATNPAERAKLSILYQY